MKNFCLSLVLPVHNEQDNLEEVYGRSKRVLSSLGEYEIIFVNDGSTDGSLKKIKALIAKNKNVKAIDLSRNFGHQIAITAGLDYANGDAVVIMDSDLQDIPEIIPKMVARWQAGYEIVYAKRRTRKDSIFKKATAFLFYRMLRFFAEIDIPVDVGDFQLLDKKVVTAFKRMREKSRFVRGLIAWTGFKKTVVFFNREKRKHGKTSYSLRKMIRFALEGLTSFSVLPLKLNYYLGAGVLTVGLLFGIYSFSNGKAAAALATNSSLAFLILVLIGTNFLMIGVLAEYLSRTHQEVKKRPLYIVRKFLGLKNKG